MHNLRSFLLVLFGLAFNFLSAQEPSGLVSQYLEEHRAQLGLTEADIANWVITDAYTSSHNQVRHVYIRQTHQDIEVYNAVANFNILNGQVLSMGNRLIADVANQVNGTAPTLTPMQAVEAAAQHLGLSSAGPIEALMPIDNQTFLMKKGGISLEDIPVKLMYQPTGEGEIRLAWDLSIYTPDAQHWWSLRVDAETGKVLDQVDWVTQCNLPHGAFYTPGHSVTPHRHAFPAPEKINAPDSYRVLPVPVESPNHGSDSLIVNPADPASSPFGWHDDNGATGAEYTITRGNNVHAYEDRDNDNAPGYAPDGGPNLDFDFPFNLNQQPIGYQDAAITNLFYWNNIMHDVWYRYGFDEASGNFQENNYGNGGQAGDYVRAEAQDGGGLNNANFATPPDGQRPRMQMYLWSGGGGGLSNLLTINSPSTVAGQYVATEASFGPGVPATPITADLVLVDDGTPDPANACEPIINGSAISGKIAVIRRGGCTFVEKVEEAQSAGAIAVIVVNNVGGNPIVMGGFSGNVNIPSIMITQTAGNAIINQITSGNTVNGTIQNLNPVFDRDGDFDNGIIAHEYTHGISIRLTGGPSTSSCLSNSEQMGEGWSDWFGMMVTFDTALLDRGIGTFAVGEPITGTGIRPAPYSSNFAINPYTYDNTNNSNQLLVPHGVGFAWATVLWDLTLAFIDQYGYDPNLYTGTGGNNMVMQLVTDGLKLQPCSPGFVDGRDAILLADQINNGGANQCLIWEVFAARGLGASADQGSSGSRSDQVEAFDIPTLCQTPVTAPTSDFSLDVVKDCRGVVSFTDASTDIPQEWLWDFGDGNTDTIPNPTHTYQTSGVFLVTLIVNNTLGSDTSFQTVVINLPPEPVVPLAEACLNDSVSFNASSTGQTWWYDANGNFLDTGNVFTIAALSQDTTLLAENVVNFPAQNVGPLDPTFGGGGYHGNTFLATLNFTAEQEFTLVSAWVDAGSAGTRTFYLWDNINGSGNIIDTAIFNIPAGQQRVNLDIHVPGPGTYSIGAQFADLFRNNNGPAYPYEIPGLVSIFSSSATTGPSDFYYYLYDWEVQESPCRSPLVPVEAKALVADFVSAQAGNTFNFTDQSVNATSWSWDFGDGNTSTQQNPQHTYTASGTYTVTLTINNGICGASEEVDVVVAGLADLAGNLGVRLQPNPAERQTTVVFDRPIAQTIQLDLMSVEGKTWQSQRLNQGTDRAWMDLESLPAGVYLVRLRNEQTQATLKLVVGK